MTTQESHGIEEEHEDYSGWIPLVVLTLYIFAGVPVMFVINYFTF